MGNNPLPPPVISDPCVPLMGRTVPPIVPDPTNRETRGWLSWWPGRTRSVCERCKQPWPYHSRACPAYPFSYVDQVVDEYARTDMSVEQLENDLEIAIVLDEDGHCRAFERPPRYFKNREGR